MPQTDLESIVPGLAEARRNERQARSIAWVSDALHDLCGIVVCSVTLGMIHDLEIADNPVLCFGRRPTKSDLFQFFLRLSPAYEKKGFDGWMARRALGNKVQKICLRTATRECRLFIAKAEQDQPPRRKSSEAETNAGGAGFHWMAGYVNFFGDAYGWSARVTANTPVAQLHQLYRAWHRQRGHKIAVINRSDRLVSTYVRYLRDITTEAPKQ